MTSAVAMPQTSCLDSSILAIWAKRCRDFMLAPNEEGSREGCLKCFCLPDYVVWIFGFIVGCGTSYRSHDQTTQQLLPRHRSTRCDPRWKTSNASACRLQWCH